MEKIEINREERGVTIYSDFFLIRDFTTDILVKEFSQKIEILWKEPEGIIELENTKYSVRFEIKDIFTPKLSVEEVLSNTNPRNNY